MVNYKTPAGGEKSGQEQCAELSQEKRKQRNKKEREKYAKRSQEEKEERNKRDREQYAKRSQEEKEERNKKNREWYANLSKEEKEEYNKKQRERYAKFSKEEKEERNKKDRERKRERRAKLSKEEKEQRNKKNREQYAARSKVRVAKQNLTQTNAKNISIMNTVRGLQKRRSSNGVQPQGKQTKLPRTSGSSSLASSGVAHSDVVNDMSNITPDVPLSSSPILPPVTVSSSSVSVDKETLRSRYVPTYSNMTGWAWLVLPDGSPSTSDSVAKQKATKKSKRDKKKKRIATKKSKRDKKKKRIATTPKRRWEWIRNPDGSVVTVQAKSKRQISAAQTNNAQAREAPTTAKTGESSRTVAAKQRKSMPVEGITQMQTRDGSLDPKYVRRKVQNPDGTEGKGGKQKHRSHAF